jgi:hypothetical protein
VKCFCSIWFFFRHFNIDAMNILIIFFWLMEFVFITKIIPNPLKSDVIVGDTFGVFFQLQMTWHKLFWKVKGMLKMPMKENINFICFEMINDALPTLWRTQMWVQVKDSRRRRSGTRSLAHNTLRGRGVCWSSGMGLGRIDKLIHSHGPAHNPHKVVSA